MRIVFLARSLDPGGAERQLAVLAKGLQAAGHDTVVAVFYSGGSLESLLENTGVSVVALKKRGRWDVASFFLRLVRFLRALRPDIIHGYMATQNILAGVAGLLVSGSKVVWGIRTANLDVSHYDWLHRLVYRFEARLARLSDLVIVNSHAGRRHGISSGFPPERVVVIPNGIDVDYFRPDTQARKQCRTKWNVAETTHVVGLVARLDPLKDHKTFLSAAEKLCERRNDIVFVCAGDGPKGYRAELKAFAADLGLRERIIWEFEGVDVRNVYNGIDVLCSSSTVEGFPNTVAEAMACAVPCVVTDVGDSSWIVGPTGFAVPPRDAEALANALESLLERVSSARGVWGTAARSRIVENFTVDRLVERTLTALQALM